MAIFFQHSINDASKLGIWKIEEAEDFFLSHVPLKQQVTHPYKRLQHLAGRMLLQELFVDFPLEEILIADTRKPFLEDEMYHFSISHCGNFAAAIASSENRVGVDIEFVSPRLKGISPKFFVGRRKNIPGAMEAFVCPSFADDNNNMERQRSHFQMVWLGQC